MIRASLRRFLAWSFQPPKWAQEASAVFDAYAEDNARIIARMDAELVALRTYQTPELHQGRNPFIPDIHKEEV